MQQEKKIVCPDCEAEDALDRRDFLWTAAASAAGAAGGALLWAEPRAQAAPTPKSAAETAVKTLYDTLNEQQKKVVCFDWDYRDSRGLLRTHVSNNWHITKPTISSDFYTSEQKALMM